jgi:hypothetical protein
MHFLPNGIRDLHSSDVSPKTAQKGYEIFTELLLRFQPEMLILHGRDAQKVILKLVKSSLELTVTKAQCFTYIFGSFDVLMMMYPDGRREALPEWDPRHAC